MSDQIDGEKFIALLTARFPDVTANIDECEQGELYIVMGYLARATQTAISEEDTTAVRAYFRFIADVYRLASPEVKNAVHVSYLECLSFDGRHGKRIKARQWLSSQLQEALRGLEEYNAALFHSAKDGRSLRRT
jgi:hypothetical protein